MTTSKKYNVSTGQCLIGLEFENPCNKVTFEKRAEEFNYKLQELIVNDPLLKIITAWSIDLDILKIKSINFRPTFYL